MRSVKATKRYLLAKEWIDAGTCKLIVFFLGVIVSGFLIEYLATPPEKRTVEKREYSDCKYPVSNPKVCTEIIPTKPAVAGDGDGSKANKGNSSAEQYKPNEFIKDSRDIAAQEGMWRATNFVAVATFGQLILGVLGLALIYGTLVETRKVLIETKKTTKAASDTVNVARIAERAYMFSDSLTLTHEGGLYNWCVDWENQGNTPAEKCSTIGGWFRVSDKSRAIPMLRQLTHHHEASSVGAKGRFGQRFNIPNSDYVVSCLLDADRSFFVWSSCYYTDVFGESRKASVCYQVILPVKGKIRWPKPDAINKQAFFDWRYVTAEWVDYEN